MKKFLILLAILISTTSFAFAAEISTDAMLEYNQGIDFFKIGQYDRAIGSFKEAIRLDPNYIDAYYNLGSVLEYLQQYDAALAVFKQIIVRQPNDYDSIYKAAWISSQLGQYEKAKTYLGIIPPNCARAKDAQELAAQLKTHIAEAPKTEEPVVSKPMEPKPTIKESNNIYKNITAPTGIATDSSGNVYVAEFGNNSIVKITPDEKRIVYVKDPKINGPIGIERDKAGNLYIANYNKDNVLKVSNLGEVSVLISNVKKPYCLHISGDILFVSCQGTDSVLKYRLSN